MANRGTWGDLSWRFQAVQGFNTDLQSQRFPTEWRSEATGLNDWDATQRRYVVRQKRSEFGENSPKGKKKGKEREKESNTHRDTYTRSSPLCPLTEEAKACSRSSQTHVDMRSFSEERKVAKAVVLLVHVNLCTVSEEFRGSKDLRPPGAASHPGTQATAQEKIKQTPG